MNTQLLLSCVIGDCVVATGRPRKSNRAASPEQVNAMDVANMIAGRNYVL